MWCLIVSIPDLCPLSYEILLDIFYPQSELLIADNWLRIKFREHLNIHFDTNITTPTIGLRFRLYSMTYCLYTLGLRQSRAQFFNKTVFMPPKKLRSISPILFKEGVPNMVFGGIPNLVFGCILRWQSVVHHPWVLVTLTLTSDLVSRNCFESGTYLLYYLR